LSPSLFWPNIQLDLQEFHQASIVFDDTVFDKRYSQSIELVRRQSSGTEHKVLPGIGLINCVYINPELDKFWVIDYRIYEPLGDGKSKLEHVADMLYDESKSKTTPFC